jgi:hypothetical protein
MGMLQRVRVEVRGPALHPASNGSLLFVPQNTSVLQTQIPLSQHRHQLPMRSSRQVTAFSLPGTHCTGNLVVLPPKASQIGPDSFSPSFQVKKVQTDYSAKTERQMKGDPLKEEESGQRWVVDRGKRLCPG